MPVGMEQLVYAKGDKLKKRLADVKRAIGDIYATSQEVDEKGRMTGGRAIDLEEVTETGEKKYFINDITGLITTTSEGRIVGEGKTEVSPLIEQARKQKDAARAKREQAIPFEDRINNFAQRIID